VSPCEIIITYWRTMVYTLLSETVESLISAYGDELILKTSSN